MIKFRILFNLLIPLIGFMFAAKGETQTFTAEPETCPTSDKTPDKISIDTHTDVPYEDPNREVKDFGTKFVVNEFWTSKDTLFNFVKFVYGAIDEKIKLYRDFNELNENAVFFLFKGGNVMRIVAKQFFSLLPPQARDLLLKTYADKITRSDADFSVFIDESQLGDKKYDTVLDEVTELVYRTLNEIRDEFQTNPEKYFNFFQLKTAFAERRLARYFTEELEKLPALNNAENPNWYQAKFVQFQLLDQKAKELQCQYEGQNDYVYDFDPNNKEKIVGDTLTDDPSWIMNSLNRTLEWPAEGSPGKIVKFHLVRAKVQFEYTFKKDDDFIRKPIGGELIDVSFPHKDDFRVKHFLENRDAWVADYTLTLDETNESFPFKSESIAGLSADIQEILFKDYDRPWKDKKKYAKRFRRLNLLSLIDMASSFGVGSKEAKTYIEAVQDKIIKPLEDFFPTKKTVADKLIAAASELAKDYPQMPTANKLWEGLASVAKRIETNQEDEDEEKFKEYINDNKEYLDLMLKLTEMPTSVINQKDIYKASMNSLF